VILWSLVAALFVADGVLFWSLRHAHRRQRRVIDRLNTEPVPGYDDHQVRAEITALRKDVGDDLEDVAGRMKNLTMAVAEGIERVDRSERRIGATIKRAQAKLAESGYDDPAIAAEIEGLRLIDGAGGLEEEVPPLLPGVGDAGGQPSSVPGLTVAQLQRVRGL